MMEGLHFLTVPAGGYHERILLRRPFLLKAKLSAPPTKVGPGRGKKQEPLRVDHVVNAVRNAQASGHSRLAEALLGASALAARLATVDPQFIEVDTAAAFAAEALIRAGIAAGAVARGEVEDRTPWELIIALSFAQSSVRRGAPIDAVARKYSGQMGYSVRAWALAIRTWPGSPPGWRWASAPQFDSGPLPVGRPPKCEPRRAHWDVVLYRLVHDIDTERDVGIDAKQLRDWFNRQLRAAGNRD